MQKYILNIVTLSLTLVFICIVGEIVTRGYYFLKYSKIGANGSSIILDEDLGWKPAPNYVFEGKKLDATGESFYVKCTTDHNGFRIFDNPQETTKKKVLFIGDSFTHSEDVSDNKTYFAILKDVLSIETFAFGCHGYGTLQEYLILDKWIDKIRPDIIVMQFCSNDLINNYYELEVRSKVHNNGMRRPYLTKDGIEYKNPNNFSIVRNFANKHSRFLYVIINMIDKINKIFDKTSVESLIVTHGKSYLFYKESIETTERLIKQIRLRTPSTTQIYFFSADYFSPYYEELKRISKENGIYFIDGIPQSLLYAEAGGITVRAKDRTHWNEKGHQIVAYLLKEYIESHSCLLISHQ